MEELYYSEHVYKQYPGTDQPSEARGRDVVGIDGSSMEVDVGFVDVGPAVREQGLRAGAESRG